MGLFTVGPKFIKEVENLEQKLIPGSKHLALHKEIASLKNELIKEQNKPPIQVIKEIPIEVKVVEEKIVEKPIYINKEIIKEFPVILEKIKEVPVEVKVIQEKIVEKPIEVIKEVEKIVINKVSKIPHFVYVIIGLESLVILLLMFKK